MLQLLDTNYFGTCPSTDDLTVIQRALLLGLQKQRHQQYHRADLTVGVVTVSTSSIISGEDTFRLFVSVPGAIALIY